MSTFLLAVSAVLLLNVAVGLTRVVRGPTRADRMVAAQLFGTTGVAVLLTLAQAMGEPALRDLALVVVLLAVVISVAFVKRGWVRQAEEEVVEGGPSPSRGNHGG